MGFGGDGEFEVAEIGEEAVETELRIADVFEFDFGFVDFGGGIDGEAAGAGDDVGSLRGSAGDGNGASDALIDVGVAGKNGVGIEAGGGAGRVDGIAQFGGGWFFGAEGKRRMVDGDDDAENFSRVAKRFEAGEFVVEKKFLRGVEIAVAFGTVAVKADDGDEGRVEREINAGLNHGGAIDAARFLGMIGLGVDEGFDEAGE